MSCNDGEGPGSDVVELLRSTLPPVIHGPRLDKLTGGVVVWRTVQNGHSAGLIPDSVFFQSGSKKCILTGAFLDWWQTSVRQFPLGEPVDGPQEKKKAAPPEPNAPALDKAADASPGDAVIQPSDQKKATEPATGGRQLSRTPFDPPDDRELLLRLRRRRDPIE